MSDPLYDKTEALLKSLLSVKRDSMRASAIKGQDIKTPKLPSQLPDFRPPKIKGPSVPTISTTPSKPKGLPTSPEKAAEMIKVPGGLPPPEAPTDPDAVAAQAQNAAKLKKLVAPKEMLKVEKNGQWYLKKATLDPAHGITFQHTHHDLGGDGDLTHVKAVHPVHGTVGEAMYQHQPDGSLQFTDVTTHPEWRRMGIASGMTQHAMGVTGKTIGSHTPTTDAGAAFKQGAIAQNPVAAKQLGKSESHKDLIPGGLADDKKPSQFPKNKLKAGAKVEKEHTSVPAIAEEIAMDHLTEDPQYYKKLKTIEKK